MRRLILLTTLLASCGTKNTPHDASVPFDASLDAMAITDAEDAQAGPIGTWVDLVREEQWTAAAAAIDSLADVERQKPRVRFARAMVALQRDDGKTAITALDGLDAALPTLGAEIARERARAQAIAGPFAQAGEWLETHAASNDDHVAAASAFMKAKLPSRANAECARVIGGDHKSHAQEAAARSIRLHTGESADAVGDARWLLVHGDTVQARDAETVLAKEDPKHPLTARELLSRARALADAALLDEALHAIEKAQSAGGVSATAIKRARADAMMRARIRYTDAAAIFKQCASGPEHNPEAASDLVWSARALSRADHDDEAIERYEEVVTRFPKSPEAAAATYFSGRLELLHGRFDKAAARLDEYATKYAGGADRDDALHLRAIARFEQGDGIKRARALLEERAGAERDPVARARMTNLAALAALKDGDRTHAIARFTDVVKSLPLSWPAQVARARLMQLGAAVPAAMAPALSAEPSTPLAVTLPEAVATLDAIGLDGAAEEALRSRESEVTASSPSRAVEALCIAYGKIDRGHRRMQLSLQASPSYLESAPGAATRWAWDCAYPAPYASAVRAAEIKETLPEGLLHAVMRQESAFDERAVSPARAIGVLQLLPETGATVAKEMGIQLDDPRDLHGALRSIALGARYLHDLLIRTHGSVPLAVAAYNAGSDSVLRWASRMHAMEIDAFVESIPFGETRNYVVHVMESFARYAYLAHGEAGVPKIELALP